jgi:alpha-ribazole phosphatase
MKLVLVRHTTPNIASGICYGQSDILPSGTFKEEASAVNDVLSENYFDTVYSSPLKRCTMLAGFCGFVNAKNDRRLMEMNFGDWEMKDWKNIHGQYATKWMENYLTVPAPNGECLQDLINRISDFIDSIKKTGVVSALCFTHSGPIRVVEHLINNVPPDELFDFEVAFGGVYTYSV